MPEYLSPGVYIEEVDTGNKPIEGVATSTVGFLGITERGPEKATFITSFSEYVRVFGKYINSSFLAYAVEGFFQNGGKRCFVMPIVSASWVAAAADISGGSNLNVTAIGKGDWANKRVAIKITQASIDNQNNAETKDLTKGLFNLTVIYWDSTVMALPDPPLDPTDPKNIRDPKFRNPTVVEKYENLSPNPLSNDFYARRLNDSSTLVNIDISSIPANATPKSSPNLYLLQGGKRETKLTSTEVIGDPAAEPGQKQGLAALEEIDEIAILCCPDENPIESGIAVADNLFNPGITNGTIAGKLIEQCERLKDRFAIIQSPMKANSIQSHFPSVVSKYAGYYYPWIRVLDPRTQKELVIPPGGHIAGIYARTDIQRGVHKAPANEVIRGLLVDPQDPARGIQIKVTKEQQDLLNPRGVNVLRNFPGRGNLVWGARTTTLDPDWKYVNVRRLFIFVEESIEEATQWVVFEPNDEPLWARVRRSVGDFLTRLWMDGMLQGRTREEAYFVRCDRTTMTQADIDNGRLIVLVGIAPVKPAEFVIFRIGQWTGGSEVSEG